MERVDTARLGLFGYACMPCDVENIIYICKMLEVGLQDRRYHRHKRPQFDRSMQPKYYVLGDVCY